MLAFQRSDLPDQWQMPQGGLKKNEEPLQAAYREIEEETGILASQLEFVGNYPEPLVYELPPDVRKRKTGRGQVQYWFLFKLTDNAYEFDPLQSKEFKMSHWMLMSKLLEEVVSFRVPVYRKLAEHFTLP